MPRSNEAAELTVSLDEARDDFDDLVERVGNGEERVFVRRPGKPTVALVRDSDVIRSNVTPPRISREESLRRVLRSSGIIKGPPDLAENHDKYLAEVDD
jgi:antitoxin (DNA-binding transcriptional repressor) of toxin-antitoxin stability system